MKFDLEIHLRLTFKSTEFMLEALRKIEQLDNYEITHYGKISDQPRHKRVFIENTIFISKYVEIYQGEKNFNDALHDYIENILHDYVVIFEFKENFSEVNLWLEINSDENAKIKINKEIWNLLSKLDIDIYLNFSVQEAQNALMAQHSDSGF
jgi:hypothetical protein